MKQLKPYKELVWDIVKANDKILNARRLDCWYSCTKRKPIFDIEATTVSGERYVLTLWNDNTLLYSLDGVTEMTLTAEQRTQLQDGFGREFDSANLHLGAMMEFDGRVVYCVSAFIHYRWMGLREFRRCAGDMSATMEKCAKWLKQHLPDFVQRKININFPATHNLLVENHH
ncbi:MAG: hypothetical protein IKA04_01925 [Alistipes sp.]|nr:hypothetical protein [Alistipes sp.]